MGRNLAALDDDCTLRAVMFGMVDTKIGEIGLRASNKIMFKVDLCATACLQAVRESTCQKITACKQAVAHVRVVNDCCDK